jgi:hypothetical protein
VAHGIFPGIRTKPLFPHHARSSHRLTIYSFRPSVPHPSAHLMSNAPETYCFSYRDVQTDAARDVKEDLRNKGMWPIC